MNKISSSIIGILLGIIGALLGYYSIILSLPSEIRKLENLLNNNKQLLSINENFILLENRIKALENLIIEETGVRKYNTVGAEIPKELKEKQEIYKVINNTQNNWSGKQKLIEYIYQEEDNAIAKRALAKFIQLADSADIDALMSLRIAHHNFYNNYHLHNKIKSFFNNSKNFENIVKSLLKNMEKRDWVAARFIRELSEDHSQFLKRGHLYSLLSCAREKNLKDCLEVLEEEIIKKDLAEEH